jgi:hypothetical protein
MEAVTRVVRTGRRMQVSERVICSYVPAFASRISTFVPLASRS